MGALDAPGLSLASADARYARSAGYLNIGAATTRKFRKSLAAVRAGSGSSKILAVGDSTTWGSGNTGVSAAVADPTKSWTAVCSAALNSYFAPCVTGLAVPPSSATGSTLTTASDSRFSAGTGWVLSQQGFGGAAAFNAPNGITTTLTFTAAQNADVFDIYWLRNTTLGTIAASIDGGAVTNINTAGAASIQKTSVTVTAGTGHVLSMVPAGGVYVLGVEPRLTTLNSLRFSNAGVPSSRTSSWIGTGSYFGLDAIRAYAPDLSIVMLGINDSTIAVTAATYLTNLTTIATACALSGDVILMSVVPSQIGSGSDPALEAEYQAQAQALALSAGYGYIDIYGRFGSYVTAAANGWMYDSKHPTATGYADIAGAVLAALRSL